MTQSTPKSWPKRLRSFAAFPLPLLLMLIAISSIPKDMAEPAFMHGWPVEAKAIALFVALTLLPLVLGLWSKWIDPNGYGARFTPLNSVFDNGVPAAMAAIVVLPLYGKQLTNLSVWWIGIGMFFVGLMPVGVLMVRALRGKGEQS